MLIWAEMLGGSLGGDWKDDVRETSEEEPISVEHLVGMIRKYRRRLMHLDKEPLRTDLDQLVN